MGKTLKDCLLVGGVKNKKFEGRFRENPDVSVYIAKEYIVMDISEECSRNTVTTLFSSRTVMTSDATLKIKYDDGRIDETNMCRHYDDLLIE